MFGKWFLCCRVVEPTYFWDLDLVGNTFVVYLEECFEIVEQEELENVVGPHEASILLMYYPTKEIE